MQKYKNILITGANSFLGTNTALELSRRGIHTKAIVRHSNHVLDSTPEVEIIRGDVKNFDDLNRAAAGADCIVHIAAITDQGFPRYSIYRDFNVGVTQNVINVARASGIKRIIYVSSANTIGNGTPENPSNEMATPRKPYSTMHYGRSKIEAEELFLNATDLHWTILNPTYMLGPNDTKPSSGAIILMGYGKRVVWATPGGKNIVSVEAAAKALCNAIEVGRKGEKYLLAGEGISIREFFRRLNPQATIIILPRWLLAGVGYVGNLLRCMGFHTALSADNMRVICNKEYYQAEKAERELSLEKTDIDLCMMKAVEWFRSESRIK